LTATRPLWRAFPWDSDAVEGDPFSALHRPRATGSGRFDLPGLSTASSWYFAESAEHAIGERLQDLRNQRLESSDLWEAGHPLALVSYRLDRAIAERVVDLCDPSVLVHESIAPDVLASSDRRVTQAVAGQLHAAGHPGFRWWSALIGEWHTTVLFTDRLPLDALRTTPPERVTPGHPAVLRACEVLGIRSAR
jgi:hypothetical protein